MNDIDEIRKRMLKRRSGCHTLTDKHFSKLYNGMIKCMVVLMVGVAIGAYVKVSPNGEYVKDYIFNETMFHDLTKWINQNILTFYKDESLSVSSTINYQNIKDNLYTNNSNEVLNFTKGRVIYVGEQAMLGQYVTVLLENNIEVTFGKLNDIFVGMYDQVDKGTILGTYSEEVIIIFTQGEKEIDYSTFEEIIA